MAQQTWYSLLEPVPKLTRTFSLEDSWTLNCIFACFVDDRVMESDAVNGLGMVYHQMGEYTTALRYHQSDLEIAERLGMSSLQCRACGNLGKIPII